MKNILDNMLSPSLARTLSTIERVSGMGTLNSRMDFLSDDILRANSASKIESLILNDVLGLSSTNPIYKMVGALDAAEAVTGISDALNQYKMS